MASPVEQIKERLNIVEVVSSYVKLTKAGRNYKGLSPFNKEKTPSFFVSPDRGVYYCFSSHKGGDIFTFIEEMEGLDFRGALSILAERAGVELTRENKDTRDKRERLFQALEESTAYFEEALSRNSPVMAYLKKRGISEASVKEWRLGYSPKGWEHLKSHLLSKGFTIPELEGAGLVKRGEEDPHTGKYYDRFRNRIMFPIADVSSRIIAFSGRAFGDGEEPKYLNSPETELFEKGRVLYGLNRAKSAIRKNNFSVLVEGQVDVILSHQAGFKNAVAVSGTALTNDHLSKLKQVSENVVFAFDADAAGIASSRRGAALALPLGMNVKVAPLPKGADPADVISEDAGLWRNAIRSATHIIEHTLSLLAESEKDKRALYLKAREMVLPLAAKIANKIDQSYFISYLASYLHIPEASIREELLKIPPDEERDAGPAAVIQKAGSPPSRRETIEKSLVAILWWQEGLTHPVIDVLSFTKRFSQLLGEGYASSLLERLREKKDQLAFEAEIIFSDTAAASVDELFVSLEGELLKESYFDAMERLKYAEENGRKEDVETLLLECKTLSDQLLVLKEKSF